MAALTSFVMVSCSDDWEPAGSNADGEGQLRMSEVSVVNKAVEINRSSIDVSNFIVAIYNKDGVKQGQWAYSQMPELVTLPVADGYYVEVISHNQEKAAWEKPYFEGKSQTFAIANNKITEVEPVVCKFSNLKVTVDFGPTMQNSMADDCKVTVVVNDEGLLEFVKGETRAGYFQVLENSPTMVAIFTGTVNGNFERIVYPLTDIEAGQHRIITYDIKLGDSTLPDETGFIDPESGITIDQSVIDDSVDGNVNPGDEDVIDGDRPGNEDPEDPENPDDPTPVVPDDPTPGNLFDITASWIEEGTELSSVEATPEDGGNYEVTIKATNKLANIIVRIDSESLNDDMLRGVGLAAQFELSTGYGYTDGHPDETLDLSEALSDPDSFNFPVGNDVIGKEEVLFDITPFVPLLNIYPGELHIFHLTVVDQKGNQQTVSLKFRT